MGIGEVGRGKDLFRHAQGPALENSLTQLAHGMFQLHRKESRFLAPAGWVRGKEWVLTPSPGHVHTHREVGSCRLVPLREGGMVPRW